LVLHKFRERSLDAEPLAAHAIFAEQPMDEPLGLPTAAHDANQGQGSTAPYLPWRAALPLCFMAR
jgi:hypothetical protein